MAADEPLEVENWVRERVLGSGGFGQVTLWRHKTNNEMIALKKCRTGTDALLTEKHKERWSKEVEIMQRLNHRNVVKAIAVPPDLAVLRSKLPLMCMEFCSKGDLRQVLNRSENCCGLCEAEVRSLISDVKSAVQYLHSKKITHRDLKPENIVLQQEEDKIVYKLIDLGYAKELDQNSICTSFVGTLQYLAPELFMSKSYNYSVDYWSLGLVSHEVITGVRPFLPNMAPVLWMTHVKEKSSDDICAYQAEDGSIVFSKELFRQNHISSCLKYYMERWLTYLLEWDPAKRGRAPNKNKEKEIVFDFIDDILSKKIVNVFSLPTYQNLSYEIDNSTAVSTLQLWIQRDTELDVKQQELLLPSGQPFDMTKEACQCWVPRNGTNQNVNTMVYVFHRGSLAIERTLPSIPQTVSKMMEGPRDRVEYIHQKRAWAHAVFFLQQEMELYQTFLEALGVKMLHVISNNTTLNEKARAMVSQLQQVEAQLHLSLESLHFDESEAKKIDFFSEDVLCSWSRMSSALGKKITTLKDVVHHLQSKCESVNKKTLDLQKKPYIKMRDNDILASLLDAGQKCYDSLRRRSKDSRQERTDNIEMVKVVYSCLKHRDKLLNDRTFDTCLQQVIDVQAEIEQLWSPLQAALQVMNKIQTELRQTQLNRQQDIWMQMARDQCNGFTALSIPAKSHPVPNPVVTTVSQALPAERNVNNGERNIWTVEPTCDHSPAEPKQLWVAPSSGQPTPAPDSQSCRDPVEHLIQDSDSDTSAMISDNIALRYATQDLMNESFHRYCRVLSEDKSLDWTFLDRQD